MAGGGDKPLRKFTEAFHALAATVSPTSPPMRIEALADACSQLMVFFEFMGVESKFWEFEYVDKVEHMKKVSKSIDTLPELIDQDIANKRVRVSDSNSRNLLRLKRALEVIKVLFEQLMKGSDVSFQRAAEMAYKVVFARYHEKIIQNVVIEAMSELPSRSDLLKMVNEEEESASTEMKKYVDASAIVIHYIDELFTLRNLGTDW